MDNFISIDFETANNMRTSACQIGIVVVENKIITEEFVSFIKPVPGYFLQHFTDNIHGIDKNTVKNAPYFDELWENIRHFFENSTSIVAHNASFDQSVLSFCLEYYNIEYQLPLFTCTVKGARKLYPHLDNHRLSTVCKHIGFQLNHHEALSDARGSAMIALEM